VIFCILAKRKGLSTVYANGMHMEGPWICPISAAHAIQIQEIFKAFILELTYFKIH